MTLVTGRWTLLRELQREDCPFMVEARNHPDVQLWLPSWEPLTLESQLAWLRNRRAAGDLLLAYCNPAGEIQGSGSLYAFDRAHRVAEYGRLFFAPGFRNAFAVIEAYTLTLRYGFERLGLHRIHGATATTNLPAIRMMEEMAYQDEGELPGHFYTPWGEVRDTRLMGVSASRFAEHLRSSLHKRLYRQGEPPTFAADPFAERFQAQRPAFRSGPEL